MMPINTNPNLVPEPEIKKKITDWLIHIMLYTEFNSNVTFHYSTV